MRPLPLLFALALAASPPLVAGADIGPGETVVDGILLDMTPAGLNFLEAQVPYMVPDELPMDDVNTSSSFGWCDLDIAVTGMNVYLELNSVDIVPQTGTLSINVNINVWVNTQGSPFNLDLDVDGFLCDIASTNCNMWVEPINISATLLVSMAIIDPGNGDPPYLDATVPPPSHNLDSALTSDRIQLEDCGLATINDILGYVGIDLVDLILDYAAEDLYAFLEEDLPEEIETAIEEGFAEVSYQDTVDILDVPLDVSVVPHDIDIQPGGIRLLFNSTFDAPQARCVAQYDPGASPFTDNPAPTLDAAATHHAAAFLSDDSIASALYAVWHGGVLCYDVDPAELGFPLDTSFLALMVDEEDRHLLERVWLEQSAPISIRTLPKNPPEVLYNGTHDMDPVIEDLGLEFYVEVQDRKAHVVTIDADVNVGVDLVAPGDGSIGVEVEVDTENLSPTVSYNEMAADLNSQIEANFSDIMSGLLDTILDSFLNPDDLVFGPMLFGGMGLSQLDVSAAGNAGDYLGIYPTLDIIDPAGVGDLGCGGEGGEGGCSGGCDESCSSSCDVVNTRSVRALWTGNLSLLGMCLAALWWQRRR